MWGTDQIFVDDLILSHTAGNIGINAHMIQFCLCLIDSSSDRQHGPNDCPITSELQQGAGGIHPNWSIDENLVMGLFIKMCLGFMETKKGWGNVIGYFTSWEL